MIDQNVIGVAVIFVVVLVSLFVIYIASNADKHDKLSKELEELRNFDRKEEPERTGGSTDKYSWDQNHEAVDVSIPLNSFDPVPTVREIDVSIKPRYLKVTVRREVYLEGYFHDLVNAEDSCWTLDREVDSTVLSLSIIKSKPSEDNLWSCFLDGEPHINLPRRRMPSIETLDPSDPSAVRQAMKSLKKN